MRRRVRLPDRGLWWTVRSLVSAAVPRRVWRSVLIPVGLLAAGTVGYPLIEGDRWSHFDGFYMTAITLTTIGYGETHPLSVPGRVFTVALAYSGVFTLFYIATEIVRSVMSGGLEEYLGRRRMEEDLAGLRGHLIVCGLGRMGKIVCDELDRRGEAFVVVDTAPPVPGEWPYRHGLLLHGDATEDDLLRRAGVDRARALIAAVGSDAANLYITLSARLLAPDLTIVARAEEPGAETKLRKVGATKVVSPHIVGGHRAVEAVLRPTALQFLEMATRPEFADIRIEEVRVAPGGRLAGRSIRDCRLGQDPGVIVVAVRRPTGELLYNPGGDVVMEPGAVLLALGPPGPLDRLERMAAGTDAG